MPSPENRIAILGAGTSGIAAARLAAAGGAAWVGVFDSGDPSRLAAAGEELEPMGIECRFGEAALEAPEGLDLVVVSPGIDVTWPIARAFAETGAPLVGEIEYAYRQCSAPVIGITGTNGKTTTTELAAAVLEAGGLRTVAGGNYGHAFSDIVRSREAYDVVTLEISSFQLETIDQFHPRVAVWMNFAPDHLDRYDSLESYRSAKLRIFENQTSDDAVIVNAADSLEGVLGRRTTFSAFGETADWMLEDGWITLRGERLIDYATVKLHGRHNAENVMAALSIGVAMGIDVSANAVLSAVRDYIPPRHRCEPVGEWEGRLFINDSKATNLHALASSLRGQEAPVVLIAGGKNKGLDFGELRDLLPGAVSNAICLGEMAEPIRAVWADTVPCEVASDMGDAVRRAAKVSRLGQSVLFSPGTSSFDMYSGYAERGDAFRDAVRKLGPLIS